MNPCLDLLLNRRSVLVRNLKSPGPDLSQLNTILTIGARVPDHRKLEPWRFIVVEGKARTELGSQFAKIKSQQEVLNTQQIKVEQERFVQAPIVVAVVFSPVEHKTPEFEQLLSCGAVCQNINLASSALGFASQWVTNWCAFDKQAQEVLGLKEQESIAGFIHIGTAECEPKERQRPDLNQKVSYFKADDCN